MSDWRQSDSGKKKPTQPKLKSPKPIGAAPVAPKPTGGWRGKGGNKGASVAPTTTGSAARSWTGAAPNTEAASGALIRKWLIVISLFVAICFLTVFLIRKAFFQPERLQLFVFSIGDHSSTPELLENPFGNYQRSALKKINKANLSALESSQYNNDNALSELNSDKWIERFDAIKSDMITGGGPSKKFVGFYISSYATFTRDDHLMIYPQSKSPFNDAVNNAGGLKLADVLSSLASRVKKNGFAWVVLDLQLPTVVSNLGDLDPPWRTATEFALNQVDEELRKRLLVTIPCDNGEQNWLAPEYSSSIFGHYYRQLLEGRLTSTTTLNPDLTVGQFRDFLHDRVASEASIRRYASQNPVWLPTENVETAASLRLITVGRQQAEMKPAVTIESSQFSAIQELWKKVKQDCFQAYRWDPLGYAKIESQLLALEEIALNRPGSFLAAKDLIDKAIEDLHVPATDFGVSLIEDAARHQFIRGTSRLESLAPLAQKFSASLAAGTANDQLPSFWKAAVAGAAAPENPTPPAEDTLAPADKPHLVWQLYSECVKSNDVRVWDEAFRPDRLEQAIAFAQDSSWLEINFLRRLSSDIDWAIQTPNRSQGCAKALALFDRLQRLATTPDPELSWWLKSVQPGFASIEARFLRGFDRLLANQTADAISSFEQIESELTALEKTTKEVAQTIATTQEALHALPHLLSWLLKEYQFASEQEKLGLEVQLQTLGQIAQHTSDVYAYLSRPPGNRIDEGLQISADNVSAKLNTLKRAFIDYVDKTTGSTETSAASANSLTFRRGRIALLSPLLPIETRERLHTNTVEFLKIEMMTSRDEAKKSTPPQRSSKLAADEFFLKQIDTDRDRWAAIAKFDARLSLGSLFGEQNMPGLTNAADLRRDLLNLEYWHRVGASVFGHSPSLQNQIANLSDVLQGARWPYSCPWQRWSLSAANERVFQVQRLSDAKWGNGSYHGNSLPEDFYFFQLAAKTTLPRGLSVMEPANQLTSELETTMRSSMSEAAAALISLKAEFGGANQSVPSSGSVRAPLNVSGQSIDAVGQIYLGTPASRLPWLLSNPKDRTWVVDFNLPPSERLTQETFDAAYWSKSQPPMGTLAIRGNARIEPINWKLDAYHQQSVELKFPKDPVDGAIIRVRPPDQPPQIRVLLLIDCSKSMDTMVDYLVEPGKPLRRDKLFPLVKQNVLGVLEKLSEIHQTREADVRVGLMPFGLNNQDVKSKSSLEKTVIVNQKNYYAPRSVEKLDDDWYSDLEAAVEDLKASGDTPLYNAIVLASEQAKENSKDTTLIFVFSDGVNLIDDGTIGKSASNVRDAIQKNPRLRLSIFHFDYFDEWIKNEQLREIEAALLDTKKREQREELESQLKLLREKPDQAKGWPQAEKWRTKFIEGQNELSAMSSLGEKQYGYYRSDQASKLMQDALDRIPRSTVRITSNGSSAKAFDSGPKSLGEKIYIPQESLAATLDVSVTGTGDSDSPTLEVEAIGGEQLLLPLDSQGRFVLDDFGTIGKDQCPKPIGDNLSSQLFVRTLFERLDSKKELGFEFHFWNGNRSSFTRRPRLLVAEVSRSNDPQSATFVLADHQFKPTTYPEARVSDIPWPGSKQPVRLRVWAADSLPTQLQQKSIAPEQVDTEKLGIATVSFAHKGERLEVRVEYSTPPTAAERIVAICPTSESAQRKFDRDSNTEIHDFRLPESYRDQPVQLQLATIGDLEEAAQAGEIKQCNFEQIDLKKF